MCVCVCVYKMYFRSTRLGNCGQCASTFRGPTAILLSIAKHRACGDVREKKREEEEEEEGAYVSRLEEGSPVSYRSP